MIRFIAILSVAAAIPLAAAAEPCPGNADALGTARTIAVDARDHAARRPQGIPHHAAARATRNWCSPSTTGPGRRPRRSVLDALKHECVRATFFLLGKAAAEFPALARRELAEGHTVGHHTYQPSAAQPHVAGAPPRPRSTAASRRTSSRSMASGGASRRRRSSAFPDLPHARPCSTGWQARSIVVFGADVWASDWNADDARAGAAAHPRPHRARRAAASCCFTIPKRRPPRCCRRSCASSKRAATAIVHVVPAAAQKTFALKN